MKSKYVYPFVLVTCLFFLWAFLHNINPILIPHLKKACQLTDTESALIDSSVYLGYFCVALPAGWFQHRFGYKRGILLGLFLYGAGAMIFLPAAGARSYGLFLTGLFVIASGATFLETVANPYITQLGEPSQATQRLNFAQSFNGVGAVIAPLLGGKFILSGIEHSGQQLQQMKQNGQLDYYLNTEASTIRIPYLVIALLVFLLLAVFYFSRLPEGNAAKRNEHSSFSFSVLKKKQVFLAVLAQLFYVGAQVGVGSFFIRFSRFTMQLPEKQAAYWWGSLAMVGFMVGRFAGTFFMRYIAPSRLLTLYAAINCVLILLAISLHGSAAVYCLMAAPFFMSIMFPTIFALGVENLGEESKIASSFIVMAIVGGGIFPLIMGQISDATHGNIQLAYVVPFLCFLFVFWFGMVRSTGAKSPFPVVNSIGKFSTIQKNAHDQ